MGRMIPQYWDNVFYFYRLHDKQNFFSSPTSGGIFSAGKCQENPTNGPNLEQYGKRGQDFKVFCRL